MSKTIQDGFLKTFDDLVSVLTLSDEGRIEMVREFAADAIDNIFHKELSESLLNAIVSKSKSEFAPEKYLCILNSIIEKEQSLLEKLHSDIASIQLGKTPNYYVSNFIDESESLEGINLAWAATEIGLYIYLSGTILSYARKAQGALLTFVKNENSRNRFYNILLSSTKAEKLYNKLKLNKCIDSDYSFGSFRYFFSLDSELEEPTEKMIWRGSTIDLALLVLTLSNNNPEWTVAERVFGKSSKSLKASASRLKRSIGKKKRIIDFRNKFL